MSSETAAFGIHLGATSGCLAVCKDGKANVVANDAGDRTTPAIVAFTEHEQSVGLAAKQGLIRNAANTVCHVKHVLGRTSDDPKVRMAKKMSEVRMIEKAGIAHYQVEYKEKTSIFTPAEILAKIYQNIREIADNHAEAGNHDAVLTVPIYFTTKQREVVRKAAEKGFNILRLLDEPSAALLAYDIAQASHQADSTVMVYRLGGTSLDVTVLAVSNGMYRILATDHVTHIGGRAFTQVLVAHFAAEFKRQWKTDCTENKRSMAKLRNASELAKHVLSTMPTAQCSVDSLCEGIDFNTTISRGRFDALISNAVSECIQPVMNLLQTADMQKSDIDKVILAGGSSKIPLVQKQLRDFFSGAEVLCSIPPDEVIALGASKQAALLVGQDAAEMKQNELQNELPAMSTNIYIQHLTEDGTSEKTIVLERDTPIPIRKQLTFSVQPDQSDIKLLLLFTDHENQIHPLAELVLDDLSGGCLVNTVLHVHSDGTLQVSCTEPTSNKLTSLVIPIEQEEPNTTTS